MWTIHLIHTISVTAVEYRSKYSFSRNSKREKNRHGCVVVCEHSFTAYNIGVLEVKSDKTVFGQ